MTCVTNDQVELAFTSTTTNAEVARAYAGRGKVGMVLEVQMGMVDRGAELAWLSQYPAEREICFAPRVPPRPPRRRPLPRAHAPCF